jgi:biopolymer transport protein TolR
MAISIGAAANVKQPRKVTKPDINITPLVDVVLVLLIIFMVVAPQMEAGESVELPVILNPDPKAKSKLDPLLVTVTGSGRILVGKKEMASEDSLAKKLAEEHRVNSKRRVLLKGEKTQKYGKMRHVFAICQNAGFSGVSLIVRERESKGGASKLWELILILVEAKAKSGPP